MPEKGHYPIAVDGLQYSNFFRTRLFDAVTYDPNRQLFEQWRAGRLAGVHVSVALWEDARTSLDSIGRWQRAFRDHGDILVQARCAADIRAAGRDDRTAVLLGFQNTSPFEDDLALVEVFHTLGIRCAQLTYNIQNFVGASCYDPTDTGLTRFGRFVVAEMNRVGMLIDLSHVGDRTSLDAIGASQRPCAITHANPRFFFEHARNKSDEVLKALAGAGGVLGLATYPSLTGGRHISLADWSAMVARTVDLIGIGHVAVGTDTALNWTLEDAFAMNMARWSREPQYGAHTANEPGWTALPDWYRSPADFGNLAAGLQTFGFSPEEVAAVTGGNWLRLYDECLGGAVSSSHSLEAASR